MIMAVGVAAVAVDLVSTGDLFAGVWAGVLLTVADGSLRALARIGSGRKPDEPPTETPDEDV